MRVLACLSPRDAGDVSVLGFDPAESPRALKARLGVVAQEGNLDLELTVLENMLVYARYFGLTGPPARARAQDLLELVGLVERAGDTVDRLSGGMKRRLQIARSLVNDPDLVLLDEPTTGLDPQARHVVWERLRRLRSEGVSLVLTTHYMDEAEQLCDRLVIMDHGRIVRRGSPQDLVRSEVGREVLEVRVSDTDASWVVGALEEHLSGHELHEGLLTLYADDAEALSQQHRRSELPGEIVAARRATLEDVFLSITGRTLRDGAD
jgi:lipooligosaccharide transport system ATP-binding protein